VGKDDWSKRDRLEAEGEITESRPEECGREKRETRSVVVPLRTRQSRAEHRHDDPDGDDPGPAAA